MGNPDIGNVTLTIQDGQLGAVIAASSEVLAVIGCCSSGATKTPTQFSNPTALVAAHGYGPAVEYAAYHIDTTQKPVWFVRMPTDTAGSSSPVDSDASTGTSVVTLTGTPYDDYEGQLLVITGGTIGTAGCVIRYSLDGGRSWSPKIAIGTASTYAIPHSGLTLNFAAGTLVADDIHYWYSTAPDWTKDDLDDVFEAFEASTQLFPALHLVGISAKTDLDTLKTEIDAYKTSAGRHLFAFASTRPTYRAARMVGTATLTYADDNPDTITRSAGSFVNDGFKAGMTISQSGSVSNDAYTYTVASVAALVLTLVAGDAVVAEAATADVALTGVELDSTYATAMRTDYDAFTSDRVALSAGGCRIRTPLSSHAANWEFRRPFSWAAAARFKQYGPHESLAKVKNGGLSSVSITDSQGLLTEHDSRMTTGLASLDGSNGRFITARTYDGRNGVYVAVPSIMHEAGSDFSRVHLRAIMDLACGISKRTLEGELADDVLLNASGYILEENARAIEKSVNQQLRIQLLQKGYASNAWLTLARDDELATPGTPLTGKVSVVPLGYIEDITQDIAFNNPAISG